MRITHRTKICVAVAVAGVVAASGAAFTATGLTNNAGPTQYIGGTVTQAVTGATLSDVAYGFTDATKTSVNLVTLTFSNDVNGKTPTIAFAGSSASFTCTPISAGSSACTPDSAPAGGVTGISVTV